ncbi:DUF3147 family protein [Candidatus Micrarchaeota archaeon]|nr:DUF3147 family protein [Candidatus Micrarchaeota archaeon]
MFSELFLFQLFLSFLIGGLAVAIAITIAEKFGSKIGALVLSLPTTSLVGFLFIGIVNSVEIVQKAVPFGIVGMALHLVFVSFFLVSFQKLGRKALILDVILWLGLAFLITNFLELEILASLGVYFVLYVISNAYFNGKKVEEVKESSKTDKKIFLSRVVFAGLMISFAVFLSKVLGAEWGGIFTMFPASTTSSLWMLANGYKKEFVNAVANRMLFFSVNFIVYTLAVYFFFEMFGIFWDVWNLDWDFGFIFSYSNLCLFAECSF